MNNNTIAHPSADVERTFIMIKPDAVQRKLVGEIIQRIERKGFWIVAMRMLHADSTLASRLYSQHHGMPFYEPLIEFTISSPVVAMVVEGTNAIMSMRRIIGPTSHAEPGSIRGDFSTATRYNLIHASDCQEAFIREASLFFGADDVVVYKPSDYLWTDSRWLPFQK